MFTEHLYWRLDDDGFPAPVTRGEYIAEMTARGGMPVHEGDDIADGVRVSTVFLGMAHGFRHLSDPNVMPDLWETMIFGGEYDQEQWRYASREEALAGHAAACRLAFGADYRPRSL